MNRQYGFPVYGTQGGGLVRQVGDKFIFVTKPDCRHGLDVGDEMPQEWGIASANELALDESRDHNQALFNDGVDELFDVLFRMRAEGSITLDELRGFFPEEVRGKG